MYAVCPCGKHTWFPSGYWKGTFLPLLHALAALVALVAHSHLRSRWLHRGPRRRITGGKRLGNGLVDGIMGGRAERGATVTRARCASRTRLR